MPDEIPSLDAMLRRLAECPAEFYQTCMTANGAMQVAAIIADHFRAQNEGQLDNNQAAWLANLGAQSEKQAAEQIRWWGILGIATWLLHDEFFLSRPDLARHGWQWLIGDNLRQLAGLVKPDQLVTDPDRREELVRLCFHAHGLLPRGETELQAADRLGTLDTVSRQRLLQATAAAERRAREVREAMARQRALESASRYGE